MASPSGDGSFDVAEIVLLTTCGVSAVTSAARRARRAGGISTLAVVMGAELYIAFVILSTTALLVMVAPHP
ncbi:MAG TPA: hypothetical protein VFY56_14840 [Propionibacteriaceae bacterium]|nr:hypothetical protein [Propionibacteriaceae bacterium]